ncbi:MAG: ATP/GTP-binding protein [Bacteroidia bacterium]|nr:ATP/GTP-binding protein [Bacteroidia bacterium]
MAERNKYKSAVNIQKGIYHPPSVNPDVFNGKGRIKKKKYSVDEYVSGILAGNRTILSQAITLTESLLPKHYDAIQSIIEKCLPYSAKSIRIGITGVPGVGKSTFVESFGLYITDKGRKLAVLAIDPSSGQTKGSILGDKTRMEKLSIHPQAFIRPSPAAGALITKADGTNKVAAESARVLYQNALGLFPAPPSGWKPEVVTCSTFENTGISELWNKIIHYNSFTRQNGYFEKRRKQQAVIRMNDAILDYLNSSFYNNPGVKSMMPRLEQQLFEEKITSYKAAIQLIDKYLKK